MLTFSPKTPAPTRCCANADVSKASCNRAVIAFADHWQQVTGRDPALLIFDSKLTTQAVLAGLDDRGIGFITLRARHPGVNKTLTGVKRQDQSQQTTVSLSGRAAGSPTRA